MPSDDDADEIWQLAKRHQYDHFAAALLLPRRHREALIVLAAYAGELQRIPDLVSEPMMAAIRLQWWRDQLAAAQQAVDGPPHRSGHQLCDRLLQVRARHSLPFGLLQGMIDAAEVELDPRPLNSSDETRQVLIKFYGALFELAARILGGAAARDAWTEAGVAYGAALRAGEYARRRANGAQDYVSRDMEVTSGAEALSAMANTALAQVRTLYPLLDRPVQGALLPLATTSPLLSAVAMSVKQSHATNTNLSNLNRASAMLWAHWRRRI